jgi:L-seryl-tRNA(Ser) seleniumtransferase
MKNNDLFSLIPKVDDILKKEEIVKLINNIPRKTVIDSIRTEIDIIRDYIKKDNISREDIISNIKDLTKNIVKRSHKKDSYNLIPVVNATGVVIHTNLGRSLLNNKAIENLTNLGSSYSNLEYDLQTGKRGSRYSHLEEIISEITGAEAAMVVNNNAAAVMLVLSTLARDSEVIVSRGELIEIGGSFRIPEVMELSGAKLREVGTTNKTHLRDYERAINEDTKALLKVHTSNYRILGFTSGVDSSELMSLKEKYEVPVVEDLGSGVLIDLAKYGLEHEATVQESLNKGVDIVTFSGDKLLGGPQAGIIVGKKEYIEEMKTNPLTRAFRIDKFTISALEASLRYYLDEKIAVKEIPTLNMLTMDIEEIDRMAHKLKEALEDLNLEEYIDISIVDSYSEVGGGSLPLEKLASKCVVLNLKDISTQSFEDKLRQYQRPIITRVYRDEIYMDLRTIKYEEIEIIKSAIKFAIKSLGVEK